MAKRFKYCMTCKVEQTSNPSCICDICESKKCTNCNKISVGNTQYDDNGKPFCPKCFRTVMILAVQAGKTDSFTLAQRLDRMEADISLLKRLVSGAGNLHSLPVSKSASIESRIDSLLDNIDLTSTFSAEDIKDKALEAMLNREDTTKTED